MSGHAEDTNAYAEKVRAQLKEAKAQIQAIETNKGKMTQTQIDAIKAKSAEIEKKRQDLKTASEAKAAQIKAEIDADIAKLKAEMDQAGAKAKSQSATK